MIASFLVNRALMVCIDNVSSEFLVMYFLYLKKMPIKTVVQILVTSFHPDNHITTIKNDIDVTLAQVGATVVQS